MGKTLEQQIKQPLPVVGALIGVACAYILVSTIVTVRSTGIVRINTSSSQAQISVGQANHEAKIVGAGKASVRLKPGVYQIMARIGRGSAVKTVTVSKNQVVNALLKLSEAPRIRSVDDVNFNGISSFSSSGLSADQLTALQLAFFRYKPSSKTITIDGSSLQPGPRNPKTATYFTTNFLVTIDSVPYKATIRYSGLTNIGLSLYSSQNNSLVFDSDAGPTTESD